MSDPKKSPNYQGKFYQVRQESRYSEEDICIPFRSVRHVAHDLDDAESIVREGFRAAPGEHFPFRVVWFGVVPDVNEEFWEENRIESHRSPAFKRNCSRYGSEAFTMNFDALLQKYRDVVQEDFEFRLLGTQVARGEKVHAQERAHAVLVVPKSAREPGLDKYNEYKPSPTEPENNRYLRIEGTHVWCTSTLESRKGREWEQLEFAFYLKDDGSIPFDDKFMQRSSVFHCSPCIWGIKKDRVCRTPIPRYCFVPDNASQMLLQNRTSFKGSNETMRTWIVPIAAPDNDGEATQDFYIENVIVDAKKWTDNMKTFIRVGIPKMVGCRIVEAARELQVTSHCYMGYLWVTTKIEKLQFDRKPLDNTKSIIDAYKKQKTNIIGAAIMKLKLKQTRSDACSEAEVFKMEWTIGADVSVVYVEGTTHVCSPSTPPAGVETTAMLPLHFEKPITDKALLALLPHDSNGTDAD